MKKHKYDPKLIRAICEDPEYFLLFFNRLAEITNDHLFVPKLRRNGDYTMKCCLHKENTPSMRLCRKTNKVKCFGCGQSGNIFRIVQLKKGIPFIIAVKELLHIKSNPKNFGIIFNPNQLDISFPSVPRSDEDDPF